MPRRLVRLVRVRRSSSPQPPPLVWIETTCRTKRGSTRLPCRAMQRNAAASSLRSFTMVGRSSRHPALARYISSTNPSRTANWQRLSLSEIHARSTCVAWIRRFDSLLEHFSVRLGQAWGDALLELGHEVHLAGELVERWPVSPRHGALRVGVRAGPERVPGIRDRRLGRGLARVARRVRPDLVHAHGTPGYGWMAARAGRGRSSRPPGRTCCEPRGGWRRARAARCAGLTSCSPTRGSSPRPPAGWPPGCASRSCSGASTWICYRPTPARARRRGSGSAWTAGQSC